MITKPERKLQYNRVTYIGDNKFRIIFREKNGDETEIQIPEDEFRSFITGCLSVHRYYLAGGKAIIDAM